MTVLATRPIADAVVALLTNAGLTTSLGQGASPPVCPSVVVHPWPGVTEGPLGNPRRGLLIEVQTTAIGATAEQAMWAHDKTATTLAGATVTATGMVSHPIWQVAGSVHPVRRDDTLATPVFVVTCAWMVQVQPTP